MDREIFSNELRYFNAMFVGTPLFETGARWHCRFLSGNRSLGIASAFPGTLLLAIEANHALELCFPKPWQRGNERERDIFSLLQLSMILDSRGLVQC